MFKMTRFKDWDWSMKIFYYRYARVVAIDWGYWQIRVGPGVR